MRYLPHTDIDRQIMLAAIGAEKIEDLFSDVPDEVLLHSPIERPPHQGELEVERQLSALAARNLSCAQAPAFLGAGAYRHHIPATVDHIIQRSEFLTAYTPYQPEISQGTLQALFEFQTQVALVSGMEVANASMYDGASGTAEAMMMAMRLTRRSKAVLSGGLHPHYRDVCTTIAQYGDTQVLPLPTDYSDSEDIAAALDDDTACVVVQNPDIFGRVHDLRPLAAAVQAKKALLVVVVNEVVSMGALMSPGEMGADIFVGEGQGLGNGLNFGGPYLGLFATRQKFVRQMPGRLCGQTVDETGRRGFVLTLSTREQHIRREKATSNICTNAGLCCLAFTIHLALLGEIGFRQLAALNHGKAVQLADRLAALEGFEVVNDSFFNEFTLRLPMAAADAVEGLAERGILGGVPVSRLFPDEDQAERLLLVTATEMTSDDDMSRLCQALKELK